MYCKPLSLLLLVFSSGLLPLAYSLNESSTTQVPTRRSTNPKRAQSTLGRGIGRDHRSHDILHIIKGGHTRNQSGQKGDNGGGTASIPNEIFNLVISIVGAGALSLPAGIAAFGDAPSALLPAIFVTAFMGSISAYTFSMIARVCSHTGASSYAEAWEKTRGTSTSWIVAVSSALACFSGKLTFSMVLADTFKDLLAALGISASRSTALLGLTGLVILPLCLVKNLSSLAPFSLLGIMGMAYTTIAIGIRCFGGAYSKPTGRFLSDLEPHMQPAFGSVGAMGSLSPKSLVLVCMLSKAYIAHFNAPKFYSELKNNTIKRFNSVVVFSFGISIVIYAAVSAMGFLTFGSSTAGLILNNYSTKDVLLSFSRFAVGVALIFSYPLLFVGTRDAFLDLFRVPEAKRTNMLLNQLTIVTLAVITVLALYVSDLTFVNSISGAVLGAALIFIYPALMFRGVVQELGGKATTVQLWESRMCSVIATLGVAIAGVGTRMALKQAAFF